MRKNERVFVALAAASFLLVLVSEIAAPSPAAPPARVAALLCLALLTVFLAQKPPSRPVSRGCPARFPLTAELELTATLTGESAERRRDILRQIILETNRDADLAELSLLLTAYETRVQNEIENTPGSPFGQGSNLSAASNHQALFDSACTRFEALASALRKQRPHPALSGKMLAFIDDRFQGNVTLTDLAEHMNMTPNYVSTLFRNEVGGTFKECLNKRRYLHAAALLENDRRIKIKDVALQSGCSVDILGRLFQRYSGVSPLEYRRRSNQSPSREE
ncbi:MAG: AraC family transcriptional regulator [Clostridia bacterium]|nr:AraC family transcriptional regulator [Clostridia bacterium]